MRFLKKITEFGVLYSESKSEKRNIIMSNYLSLVSSFVPLWLLTSRIAQQSVTPDFYKGITLSFIFIFLAPIALNALGLKYISRILVCWLPSFFIFILVINGLTNATQYQSDYYIAPRFYLLAFCSFPFLVYDLKNKSSLVIALSAPLFILFFFDFILDFIGLGYYEVGLSEPGYAAYNVRVIIIFSILSASTLFLRWLIETSEKTNEQLLAELAKKNELIQQQAKSEVLQLNDQLKLNLQQLSEREFILNQSQRIAKIGSWEYRIENNYLFWSDAMYEIFGLDKSYNLKTGDMKEALGVEGSERITNATLELLRTGQPFDIIIRTKTPIGYNKWFRAYAYPIIERDNAVGVRGICHDITFFKEAEEKLRASEIKFSKVFANYPDFIMVVREFDLMVVDVNQRISSVLGFTKEDVVGHSARNMDLFLTEEERLNFIKKYFPDGYTEYECPWKRKDGRVIQVKITAIRIDIEGHYYRMSVVQDITERKAAEEKFLKAFDLSPDFMVIFRERDMIVMETNRKILEVSGFSREEVIGTNVQQRGLDLWAKPKEREQFFFDYQLKGNTSMDVELRKKNGETFYATISAQRISLSAENHMIVVVRDITGRKQSEKEKEYARYQLNERIKELTTLYRTSQILHQEQKSLHEMLWEIVQVLPAGWQYPEIAAARIDLGGEVFTTANFENVKHRQKAEFEIPSNGTGLVEIAYTEDRPSEFEGPFFAEERNLLNMIAEMLEEHLARKHEQEALVKAQANLKATINNTEVMIWSVDRQFRLITFNAPFFNYIKTYYGIEPKTGSRMLDAFDSPEANILKSKWKDNYTRALAGQIVTLEETSFGFDFQYSLSPIIEENMVTGVSVFADNVTERKASDRDLAEANKKIGELKLMALRSVMSPHFIFNVLNSIQFFIAKNDRLNAITYLSTFSKLIRSILTHSVDNKIRLTEEIEMLKNYVQLEMVRFENKFSFVLNIDSNVDVEAIEIPSLLIQPYVENAILHGLYNKEGTGTLKIDIYEENDTVVFQIEDDGIGREAAKKLREQNFPTHKSMGIKLTEERLQLINQKHNVVFEVDDLKNGDVPAGTRVRIGVIY
jgi:PAS domain S-box-containing protein